MRELQIQLGSIFVAKVRQARCWLSRAPAGSLAPLLALSRPCWLSRAPAGTRAHQVGASPWTLPGTVQYEGVHPLTAVRAVSRAQLFVANSGSLTALVPSSSWPTAAL
jgi:hypothetical protein